MQVVIGQVFFDRLDNVAAGEKKFQLLRNGRATIINEGTNNRIVAGVLPIADRFL